MLTFYIADGEQVEFTIMVNEQRAGKKFAANVTGKTMKSILLHMYSFSVAS